jgi:predicted RNase H-like nuclease (RuvC/YqgF family)
VLVGVDPGTTTAVALVGLDGRVLDVTSTRTADTAEVIEWIIERGRPALVAADVTPMPATVEKIAASFDAPTWAPDSDLPVDEKQHRTREEGYDDDHQRDAMAAALYAYDHYRETIDRATAEAPPDADEGEVAARVLAGETLQAVLSDLEDDDDDHDNSEGPEPAAESAHDPRELTDEERRIRDLEAQVERLQAHVSDLEDELAEKDDRIEEYETELSEARREERQEARERREVTRLEWENDRLETELEAERERADSLEEKLDRLKDLWKLDHSNLGDVGGEDRDLVAVKPVEQFTVDAIETAHDEYGIAAGDVVYLRDASGAGRSTAELLADFDPRVVLRSGGLSDAADEVLFDRGIPVGPAGDVTIREVDELAVASESDVEAVVEDWRDRKAEREREQTETMVDSIISEHRADRE